MIRITVHGDLHIVLPTGQGDTNDLDAREDIIRRVREKLEARADELTAQNAGANNISSGNDTYQRVADALNDRVRDLMSRGMDVRKATVQAILEQSGDPDRMDRLAKLATADAAANALVWMVEQVRRSELDEAEGCLEELGRMSEEIEIAEQQAADPSSGGSGTVSANDPGEGVPGRR